MKKFYIMLIPLSIICGLILASNNPQTESEAEFLQELEEKGIPTTEQVAEASAKPVQIVSTEVKLSDADQQLINAATTSNLAQVQAALSRGANVRASQGGMAALHIAASNGDINIVKAIVEHSGNDSIVNVPDSDGNTPLQYAKAGLLSSKPELFEAVITYLKEHGAA